MLDWLKELFPYVFIYRKELFTSIDSTVRMFFIAGGISFIFGYFFGVLLTVTKKDGIAPNKWIYGLINIFINVFRSIPFVILLIFLIPLTRTVMGTAVGLKGAIIPLVFGTVPMFTRQVENALATVDPGKIEAARAMGTGTTDIIFRVYLHEAVPDLIRVTTIIAISEIGLTTMAGAVGAGGIGSFAINYGQGQHHQDIVNVCVIILLVTVSILQTIGTWLSNKTTNKSLFKHIH